MTITQALVEKVEGNMLHIRVQGEVRHVVVTNADLQFIIPAIEDGWLLPYDIEKKTIVLSDDASLFPESISEELKDSTVVEGGMSDGEN